MLSAASVHVNVATSFFASEQRHVDGHLAAFDCVTPAGLKKCEKSLRHPHTPVLLPAQQMMPRADSSLTRVVSPRPSLARFASWNMPRRPPA